MWTIGLYDGAGAGAAILTSWSRSRSKMERLQNTGCWLNDCSCCPGADAEDPGAGHAGWRAVGPGVCGRHHHAGAQPSLRLPPLPLTGTEAGKS